MALETFPGLFSSSLTSCSRKDWLFTSRTRMVLLMGRRPPTSSCATMLPKCPRVPSPNSRAPPGWVLSQPAKPSASPRAAAASAGARLARSLQALGAGPRGHVTALTDSRAHLGLSAFPAREKLSGVLEFLQ